MRLQASGQGVPVEVSQRIVEPGMNRGNDSIHNEEDRDY